MKRINLYGVIGRDITDAEFISQIPEKPEDLEIRVNSPGGNVFQGYAIYNAINNYKGKKTVFIDGLAASMASVICLAADKTLMAENAMFMIHNPSVSANGDSRDLRKSAETLDKIKGVMVNSYTKKSGISKDDLEQMLDNETWFTAQEALINNFIDGIEGSVLAQNSKPVTNDTLEVFASYSMPINNHKIISALGLSIDASEKDVITEINNLKSNKGATAEQIQNAKELVKNACHSKKIIATLIPHYEKLATENFEAVKQIFELLPSVTPGSEFVNEGSHGENRANWTLEDYRKNDPKALQNDKTLFERLLNNK